MTIFMVNYKNRGPASKAVEANSKEEAKDKFNAWRDKQEDKEKYSEALGAYELKVLK